jgi:uncharacterized coiled-coil DUF342 family protein
MALSLNFCQSQTIQKIGNKEMIVMSVEDGKKINESFEKKQKEIDSLKSKIDTIKQSNKAYMIESGKRLQSMYDSYLYQYYMNDSLRAQRDTIKSMYMANKKIYEHKEREFRVERIHQQVFTSVILFIAMILAFK